MEKVLGEVFSFSQGEDIFIRVEYGGLEEIVRVDATVPGFLAILCRVEVGDKVIVLVETQSRTNQPAEKPGLKISGIIAIDREPLLFSYEGKVFSVPASLARSRWPVVVTLSNGVAIRIQGWHGKPPKPKSISQVSFEGVPIPMSGAEDLAEILAMTWPHVVAAREIK